MDLDQLLFYQTQVNDSNMETSAVGEVQPFASLDNMLLSDILNFCNVMSSTKHAYKSLLLGFGAPNLLT